MKTFNFLIAIALCIGLTSCSDNDDPIPLLEIETVSISNLSAPQTGGQGEPIGGEFTKFDFTTGEVTTSDTEWDIAFRGTSIIVNGGSSLGTTDEAERTGNAAAYIVSGTMTSVTEVDTSLFVQDSETDYAIASGSGNGWYLYDSASFLISPITGKILVFETRNGTYAKMEILSYYENAPDNPDAFVDASRYYTFNYVHNPNEGVTTF